MASSAAVSAMQEEIKEESPSAVALVTASSGRKIVFDSLPIKIVRIDLHSCSLVALIDTGSPVSFVRVEIYTKVFQLCQNQRLLITR